MRRQRMRAIRPVRRRWESARRVERVASNQTWAKSIPLVALVTIGGSLVLFLICRYLTNRFDGGTPITHHVDPYLAIWISLTAVAATCTVWVVAMLENRSIRHPGTPSPRRNATYYEWNSSQARRRH